MHFFILPVTKNTQTLTALSGNKQNFTRYQLFFTRYLKTMKTEDRIQQEIVIWYTNNYCLDHHNPRCLIAHIPNQNQQKLVQIGVLPGFSDLIVIHNGAVLFIEVKTPTGTQSPAQIKFQHRITTLNYPYHIVRSLDEFVSVINNL